MLLLDGFERTEEHAAPVDAHRVRPRRRPLGLARRPLSALAHPSTAASPTCIGEPQGPMPIERGSLAPTSAWAQGSGSCAPCPGRALALGQVVELQGVQPAGRSFALAERRRPGDRPAACCPRRGVRAGTARCGGQSRRVRGYRVVRAAHGGEVQLPRPFGGPLVSSSSSAAIAAAGRGVEKFGPRQTLQSGPHRPMRDDRQRRGEPPP